MSLRSARAGRPKRLALFNTCRLEVSLHRLSLAVIAAPKRQSRTEESFDDSGDDTPQPVRPRLDRPFQQRLEAALSRAEQTIDRIERGGPEDGEAQFPMQWVVPQVQVHGAVAHDVERKAPLQ